VSGTTTTIAGTNFTTATAVETADGAAVAAPAVGQPGKLAGVAVI
jgi:hypothetical protein